MRECVGRCAEKGRIYVLLTSEDFRLFHPKYFTPMHISKLRKSILGFSCWALFSVALVHAQDAANDQSKASDEEEENAFELSPFEVTSSSGRGYLEDNSTSATSLNTLIRDLPVGIEVVNREFIEDVQATDMKEALAYSPGVFFQTRQNFSTANSVHASDVSPSSGTSANDFNDAVIIRGYTVPNQQRLGFRIGTIVPGYGVTLGGISDSANIERQEVVRGPQSLLYGINVLSGIVNFHPKKPLSEPRTSINLSIGSRGFRRATFDNTGPLIKDVLNYRILASGLEEDYEIKFKTKEHQYYGLQFDWMPTKRLKFFIEGQYAKTRINGIGWQYFLDDGTLRNPEFTNIYDERYRFGRDYFDEGTFDEVLRINKNANPALEGTPDAGGWLYTEVGDRYLVQDPRDGVDYSNAFVDLGPYYNISGPDTYREREEFDFTLLADYRVSDNFNLQFGLFYTDVDDLEFNNRMYVFNGSAFTIRPGTAEFAYNPEVDASDPSGYGVGELFLSPDERKDHLGEAIDDTKYAFYMWYERPTTSKSIQARIRAAYTLETEWFGVKGLHTFAGGAQAIKDEVSFVDVAWDNLRPYYAVNPTDSAASRLGDDPVIFRRSVFDYEPIRYDPALGELALVGNLLPAMDSDSQDDYIKRSGWYDVSLWYRGMYGVYHGRFWGDKLTLIAGLRRDAYQVKEQERLRILDPTYTSDVWQGSGLGDSTYAQTPYFAGYGDKDFEPIDALPDAVNDGVAAQVAKLRETYPNGTTQHLFDGFEMYDTKTFGLSFRVIDEVSLYYLYSEGIFPNTGQRDGAYKPFEAEETTNNEIGIKFEFLDRRISGRIGLWQIKRKNAVWYWSQAPAPARWWGGPESTAANEVSSSFSPGMVDRYLVGESPSRPIRYGVAEAYVEEAFQQLGMELPRTPRGQIKYTELEQYGLTHYVGVTARDPEYEQKGYNAVMIDYFKMMEVDEALAGTNPLKLAMDLAVRNSENLQLGGFPIYYYGYADPDHAWSHTASSAVGANVGFDEEGYGVDGQVILTPIDNYQIILGYSYQKREVTDFNLVQGFPVDIEGNPTSDFSYFTEYDVWVFLLGPDNFEDPKDPSTLKSGSIKGVDLSFVPQVNFTLWNKYSFVDGPLDGLELGMGLNYSGPTPTSVEIGGAYMEMNPYPTPDIPAHTRMDAYLGYRFEKWGVDWRLAFNVYNLANTIKGEDIVEYPGEERTRYRRTMAYYDSRSVRFSITASF